MRLRIMDRPADGGVAEPPVAQLHLQSRRLSVEGLGHEAAVALAPST
jgi:hypothetical protein